VTFVGAAKRSIMINHCGPGLAACPPRIRIDRWRISLGALLASLTPLLDLTLTGHHVPCACDPAVVLPLWLLASVIAALQQDRPGSVVPNRGAAPSPEGVENVRPCPRCHT